MVMNKKSFNVDVSDEVSELFTAQTSGRGYTKYKAIEGALRAYMALPREIQVLLNEGNTKDVYAMLVEGLVDREILKRLAELGPAKTEFLALLRQAKGKVSQKK